MEFHHAGPAVSGFLRISVALGHEELLLGVAQVLMIESRVRANQDHLLQRIASRDTGLEKAQGRKAVHGADMDAVGLSFCEDLAD